MPKLKLQKPLIGIIGGKGKMGAYFTDFFQKLGYKVLVSDLGTKLSNPELAQICDVVIVSVPIEKTTKIIQEISPYIRKESLLMDLTSIKEEPMKAMLKSKGSVVGCHPMFGPTNSLKNQIIILCQGRGGKWHSWIKNLFKENGAIIKELTAQEHDQLMTIIQSLTHFTDITLAFALQQSGIPLKTFLEYQSPAYRLRLDMMGRILYQDAGLYGNIQIQNPQTYAALKKYLSAVKILMKIVKKKNLKKFVEYFQIGADYLGNFKQKAQQESDLLIEFLNKGNPVETGLKPVSTSLSFSRNAGRESRSVLNQKNLSHLKLNPNQKFDIATLGPAFSYSDLISKKYNSKAKILYFKIITDIFNAVKSGQAKLGIVPIENKIEGSIRETMDALFETNLKITHKLILPVSHCLAVLPQTKKHQIKLILSHPQPLGQCSHYLQKHFPKVETLAVSSSSEAMQNLINQKLTNAAAIGSVESAQNLGLKILEQNLGDAKKNETHFYVIEKASSSKLQVQSRTSSNSKLQTLHSPLSTFHFPLSAPTQTAIAFYFVEDTHGTLFSVLQEFANAKINLTRIESRPAGKKMGNYIFYLDFDGSLAEKKIQAVLKKVGQKVDTLKILGSYDVLNFS